MVCLNRWRYDTLHFPEALSALLTGESPSLMSYKHHLEKPQETCRMHWLHFVNGLEMLVLFICIHRVTYNMLDQVKLPNFETRTTSFVLFMLQEL